MKNVVVCNSSNGAFLLFYCYWEEFYWICCSLWSTGNLLAINNAQLATGANFVIHPLPLARKGTQKYSIKTLNKNWYCINIYCNSTQSLYNTHTLTNSHISHMLHTLPRTWNINAFGIWIINSIFLLDFLSEVVEAPDFWQTLPALSNYNI